MKLYMGSALRDYFQSLEGILVRDINIFTQLSKKKKRYLINSYATKQPLIR